jgi:hypothetical protein
MHLVGHIHRKLLEHAYKFAGLPDLLVPSAAIDDKQVEEWSQDMYAKDLSDEPLPRTGEA